MSIRKEAEENLRVIRSLMEKATIYRAISAPTALVGGLFSAGLGIWMYMHAKANPDGGCARCFITGWLSVLAVTAAANGFFIWRAARERNEPFISAAMRKALWALLPSMLGGGFFTFWLTAMAGESAAWLLPEFWMVFYGLALLATSQFSPRSITILGWCFLLTGFASFGIDSSIGSIDLLRNMESNRAAMANLFMVATFGGFHLIYAACTWARKADSEA